MVVYLNCELTARDLDARLLIAAHLLKAGEPVVVGQVWSILANAQTCPKGVVVFATANLHQAKWMEKCRAAGHFVIAMDEENLAVRYERRLMEQVRPGAVAHSDLFLFQNARQETLLKDQFPGIRGRVTGSARIDLLLTHRHVYQNEADKLKQGGKYVLFNTSFTFTNSIRGSVDAALTAASASIDLSDPQKRDDMMQYVQRETLSRDLIFRLIAWLSEDFQDYRVVVRPHPAENVDMWNSVGNVEVVVGSNGLPWMLGAEAVIHASSTTGLEGVLMGVPCLNVGPAHPHLLVDEVNCRAATFEDAKDILSLFLRDGSGPLKTFRPPLTEFPSGGAKAIAEAVVGAARALPDSAPIAKWRTKARTPLQRRKFSVTMEQFMEKVRIICSPILSGRLQVSPLDDSLFLLTPPK